ncbi:MAG: hypothetical protein ACFFDT_10470 [Candidatus Hodarchaeota archaeon]
MRHFLIISNSIDTSKPLSLNSLTGYGRLDVLCRCITAAFFLSNDFRKDVIFEVYFRINGKILEIQGDKVRGINPDERAIAGLLKKVFQGRKFLGIRFYSENLDNFIRNRKIVVFDITGDYSIHLLKDYDSFLIGDQIGFLEEDRRLFTKLPTLSLGSHLYLSSQTITILNYLLDKM